MVATLYGLVPVIRLLKLLRQSPYMHLLSQGFQLALEALPVILFIYMLMCGFFATVLFAVEPADNLHDLRDAMWLTIISATTVGYGDITPLTELGRWVMSLLVILSTLYMSIPIGILGQGFGQVWSERDSHTLRHHVRGALMQHGFTIADLPILFSSFDRDLDGTLSLDEFKTMVNKLKIDLPEKRLLELWARVDEDEDGVMDVDEFMRFLSPSQMFRHRSDNSHGRLEESVVQTEDC